MLLLFQRLYDILIEFLAQNVASECIHVALLFMEKMLQMSELGNEWIRIINNLHDKEIYMCVGHKEICVGHKETNVVLQAVETHFPFHSCQQYPPLELYRVLLLVTLGKVGMEIG